MVGVAPPQRGYEGIGKIIQDSATPAGFELDSREFTKTKRDATLAGKSLNRR